MKPIKLNFGLGFLFMLMTSVVGFFTGYRYGGYAKDYEAQQIAVVPRVHIVKELVDPKSTVSLSTQLYGIIDLLKNVQPLHKAEWESKDMDCFLSNQSVIITADGRTHDEIKRFIAMLKTLKSQKTKTR